MTHLETIRTACIKANPEIVELKFGCEVLWNMSANEFRGNSLRKSFVLDRIGGVIYLFTEGWSHTDNLTSRTATVLEDDLKIIGRRIRLNDILLAIAKSGKFYEGASGQTVNEFIFSDINPNPTVIVWNLLKDDVSLQTPETQEFIYNLLK